MHNLPKIVISLGLSLWPGQCSQNHQTSGWTTAGKQHTAKWLYHLNKDCKAKVATYLRCERMFSRHISPLRNNVMAWVGIRLTFTYIFYSLAQGSTCLEFWQEADGKARHDYFAEIPFLGVGGREWGGTLNDPSCTGLPHFM